MEQAPVSKHEAKKGRAPTLWIIIAIKLGKGLLLSSCAVAVYALADNNLPGEFQSILRFFRFDPENHFFAQLAQNISKITPSNVLVLAGGTLLYSLFSLVEGMGLMFRVSWAGWMAIGESAFFIPIEVYELLRNASLTIVVVLFLNVLIVWYLYLNKGRLFGHH